MTEKDVKDFIKSKIETKNAPGLLRLAFHDSGTFCKQSKDGGVSGSITHTDEIKREENDGLQKSVNLVKQLKEELSNISLPDIIAISGAVAVEICGGPTIDVGLGRIENCDPAPESRLPDENDNANKLRETFGRMGLSLKDLVVLSGAHTLGDAKDKPFTDDRLSFNNSYFINLQKKELPTHLGRFKSDEALTEDQDLKTYVDLYAQDEAAFFNDFTESYKKMTSLGM